MQHVVGVRAVHYHQQCQRSIFSLAGTEYNKKASCGGPVEYESPECGPPLVVTYKFYFGRPT